MKKNELSDDLKSISLTLFEGIASPVALSVAILLRYGEYDQIASKRVDPKQYIDPHTFWGDNTAANFLRKLQDLPTSFDRKANALSNFWAGERDCFRTNLRLLRYLDTPLCGESDDGIERLIVSTRKIIAEILGPCPDSFTGRHGPGSTYGDTGFYNTVPDKMSSRPTMTLGALPFLLFQWSGTAWARACAASKKDVDIVRGNRFTTVPKDCVKDRGIAIEPSINLFYQLGLGRIIKRRLQRSGLDLNHSQDIHRRVAREASIKGHLATLDLSNASDTISESLVRLLLPRRWFEVLNMLRSPMTNVEGREVRLEKFSSMGNGYTFELETLIFLGLSMATLKANGITPVIGLNVHTFGDDIIVPTSVASEVIAVLKYFGMTINQNKSFVDGPFRESCGGDYFEGVYVRPHFIEESPSEPQQFISLANGIRRLADPDNLINHRLSVTRRAWFRILDAIPSHIRRLRGPQDLGDLVIHDETERWQTRTRSSIRYIRVWRPARFKRIGWEHFRPDVTLATALLGIGDGALGVIPRDGVIGYKVGWVPYS